MRIMEKKMATDIIGLYRVQGLGDGGFGFWL